MFNKRLPKNLVLGLIILIIFIVIAVLSLFLPLQLSTNTTARFAPPFGDYIFGADHFGRSIFKQLISGTKVTLFVALFSLLIAGGIGIPLGIFLGLRSHYLIAKIIDKLSELSLTIPTLLLAIVLSASLGASTTTAVLAIGISGIGPFIRIAAIETRQVRYKPFVEAAYLSGVPTYKIIYRHILPNIIGPLGIQASVLVALAILAESSLSYLGLGTPPPTPSWGSMLADAQPYLSSHPAYALFPGLAIAFSAYGANLIGDGLRDWFDPHD